MHHYSQGGGRDEVLYLALIELLFSEPLFVFLQIYDIAENEGLLLKSSKTE